MLITGNEYLKIFEMSDTWHAYKNAMNKRRYGSALNHNRFGNYVKRSMIYMSLKGSAIIGNFNEGFFCVSHQAPVSMRDGTELLKKLSKDRSLPVVFAVTEDLINMLIRLGFHDTGKTHTIPFRGEIVKKYVIINTTAKNKFSNSEFQ